MDVVVYSGGMDSFTLLHVVLSLNLEQGYDPSKTVMAVSFDYGQRHNKELDFAKAECASQGIKHVVIKLPITHLLTGSSLTDNTVPTPHGHYAAETMKQTVVPGRNTFMLALAMAVAQGQGEPEGWTSRKGAAHTVYYGAHSGDHHIYPDCRPEFVEAMRKVYASATEKLVDLSVLFQDMDKAGILRSGERVGLTARDYQRSWTCYEGAFAACGKCGACQERLEAFKEVGWTDPLHYIDYPAASSDR